MLERDRLLREILARGIARWFLFTTALALIGLAALGLLMRVAQAGNLIEPATFYGIMSLHGTGMIGVALVAGCALYWFVVHESLPVNLRAMRAVWALGFVGVALIAAAVMVGGYTSAWTFLYPLPAHPGGREAWGAWASATFLAGLGLVVVGFLIWCLDVTRSILARYGSLGRALGFDIIANGHGEDDSSTPVVMAGLVVVVAGLAACVVGAAIVVMLLINLADPGFRVDPLLAKNMTYFTGHTLANVQIYLGAGLRYAFLPVYAKRPWYASRPVVIAWLATLAVVMLAFFHHLYEDFAQPEAVQVIGNIASYAAALPPLTVTIFGGVLLVYRSGIRWTAAPLFLYAGMAGWAIGGWGAVLDSTPAVNQLFHNTLWVPAHFHTYMAIGEMFFMIGAVYHLAPQLTGRRLNERLGRISAILMLIGGYGLTSAWYASGAVGEPRRYSLALPAYDFLAWIGVIFASIAVLGAALVFLDFVRALDRQSALVEVPEPELEAAPA